jgi:hypothetical protein
VVCSADPGRGLSKIQTVAAIAVLLATYVVVAIGRMPGLRIDRAGFWRHFSVGAPLTVLTTIAGLPVL